MTTYGYILVMAAVIYLLRTAPMILMRRPIESPFLQSFLYYVPYVTLAVMTFPAILTVVQEPIAGALAFIVGIVCAWCGLGLFPVSLICCATVLVSEWVLVG